MRCKIPIGCEPPASPNMPISYDMSPALTEQRCVIEDQAMHPVEIAYYKPPAKRKNSTPGSFFSRFLRDDPKAMSAKNHTAHAGMFPRFRRHGKEV